MTHEISPRSDGSAAIFTVGDTPWHKLGTVLDKSPSTSEALSLAGANFSVGLRPVFADVAEEPGHAQFCAARVDGRFATVRLDTMRPLGIVSDRYTPLQNADAFALLDPLIKDGRVALETGGVLRDGADVWIMARFQVPTDSEAQAFIAAERIEPFFLLANNHSGRRGVMCALTPIRVVCANTLGLAERHARNHPDRVIGVRHSRQVEARVREAANQLMATVTVQLQAFAEQKRVLDLSILDDAEWDDLVLNRIAPLPVPSASTRGRSLYERNLERADSRRERLTWLWEWGPGHSGSRSAWEAYQALTHSIDHDENIWSPKSSPNQRLSSLFDGYHADQKRQTLERLYAHAVKNARRN